MMTGSNNSIYRKYRPMIGYKNTDKISDYLVINTN